MYKIGDYVVYKRDVCIIKDIVENYYVLNLIDDNTLTIKVLFKSDLLRNIITKEESENLIKSIPNIEIININDKLLEKEYKRLLSTGNLEDLVKIIKTTYLRNENRIINNKKIGEKDDNYFKKAERFLYNELSISLNKTYEETKEYIKYKVDELVK